jgi:hypothetical protein
MGNRTTNIVTPNAVTLQGNAGSGKYDPSFRTKGKDSPVQRYRKKKPSNKPLSKRTFGEEVAHQLLGVHEVVRKRGDRWVLYDDHTGVEIGSYKNRKAAWDQQRIRRQQGKFNRKRTANHPKKAVQHAVLKKPKQAKAQVPQTAKTPKVHRVRGVKSVKPISPLKPIRPKGLRGLATAREAFENAVALSVLMEAMTK